MPLLTEAEVLARAARTTALRKSTALESLTETASANATFDVLLSHSSNEPEKILLGIKGYLEDSVSPTMRLNMPIRCSSTTLWLRQAGADVLLLTDDTICGTTAQEVGLPVHFPARALASAARAGRERKGQCQASGRSSAPKQRRTEDRIELPG